MRSSHTPVELLRTDARPNDARSSNDARRHRGQALVEYVLIIVFVALAVALALSLLAPTINSIFRSIPPAL